MNPKKPSVRKKNKWLNRRHKRRRNPVHRELRENGPKPIRIEDKRKKLREKELDKQLREIDYE